MALEITVKDTIIHIGDTVKIAQKIKEGDKDRIQNFQGTVLAIKGNHSERTFVVRRISADGIGVERTIPADLPGISAVAVVKHARVRRAKLYYLRKRTGKAALKLEAKRVKNAKPKTPRQPRRAAGVRVSKKA